MRFEEISAGFITPGEEEFRISFGPPPERLVLSVRSVGIINPVWVRQRKEKKEMFEIVLGYSRFHAAKSLGLSPLPCRIIEHEIPDRDLLIFNIYDNLSHRELNPIEKALSLKKCLRYYEKKKVVSEIMPCLGLKSSEHILERLIGILELPESILLSIAKSEIDFSNALSFLRLEKEEQEAILSLFKTLRLGVNLQKEFMENLFECSRRDHVPIHVLLEKEPFAGIINNDKEPENKKALRMRHALRRMRYPRLSDMEASFDTYMKSLCLPPEVALFPPPFFENDEYRLNVRFKTQEELAGNLEKLKSLLESPHTQKWFHQTPINRISG